MTEWTVPLAGFWLMIVNHLWQCSLVVAVLWALDRWGLRRAPAAVRADLWTLGLVKLLVPAAVGGAFTAAVADRFATRVPAVGTTVAGVLAPAPPPAGGLDSGWQTALVAITVVWLAGVLIAVWRLGRDLRLQSRLGWRARPATEQQLLDAGGRAGVPRDRLFVAPRVPLPLVVGWLRPRILLPPRLDALLAPAELEALLRHEDCHRRRRDPLRLLIGRLACVVLWFYPPLRWLIRRFHECSEFACDEAAIATGAPTESYLRALARTIRRGLEPSTPVAAATGGGPDLMRRRLARLGRKEQPTMKLGRVILLVAALVVAVAAFLPLDVVAQSAPPPPPPPPKESPPPPPPKDAPPAPPAKQGDEKEEHLVVHPQLVKFAEPEYPESARREGVGGAVLVMILVDEDGEVGRVKLSQGVPDHPELDEAALAAARQCEFTGGTIDGEPTAMWMHLPFKFVVK